MDVRTVDRIVIDQIDPMNLVPGGTDTCIHDMVKYAPQEAVAIVGITSSPRVTLGRWSVVDFAGKRVPFMPVARVDRDREVSKRFRIPQSLRIAWGVLRWRNRIPAATIQVHRIETGAIISLLLRHRRLVQFIHNDSNGLTGRQSDSLWKRLPRVYRTLERLVFRRSGAVVLFNATDSGRVRQLRPDVRVMTTWYDPDVFFLTRAQHRLGAPVRVCWVGRFDAQKDPMLALDAFHALVERFPDATLNMIGAGALDREVRAKIQTLGMLESVHLPGAISRPQVAEAMASSDVLLLTSHYEGSPRVLAEAGAVGLPVVAVKEADTDQVLDGSTNGIRVLTRSPEGIAQAIAEAAEFSPVECARSVEHRSAPEAIRALLSY